MNILTIFSASLFNPVQHHMEKVYETMQLFPDFLEAVYQQNWNRGLLLQQQMAGLKIEANEIKEEILSQLFMGEFRQIEARDLFELLAEQNKILSIVNNMVDLILERRMEIPKNIMESYQGFIYACLNATEKAKEAIDELDTLIKEGIKSLSRRSLQALISDLGEFAKQAQQIHQEIKAEIFRIEKKFLPIQLTFLYKIFEETEQIIITAQSVGQRLQLLVI